MIVTNTLVRMVLNEVGLKKTDEKEVVPVSFAEKLEIQKITVLLSYDKKNQTYNKGLVI